jgi:hypothetical protein
MLNEINSLAMKVKLNVILGILFAFITPIIPLILIVGAAILLDTIFGIRRAKKLKEKVTSRKLSALVSKMVLYQSAVIGFFVIDKFILGDFILMFTAIPLVLTKLVTVTLLYIECKSINENYYIISGISMWSKFKEMLKRTKEIKNDIEDIIEKPIELNDEGELGV